MVSQIIFKNQYEKVNEAIDMSHQVDEFEQGQSGYIFDNIKKLTLKMLRYHAISASFYCILPRPFCSSKTFVDLKNDDNYCFLWSTLAQKKQNR